MLLVFLSQLFQNLLLFLLVLDFNLYSPTSVVLIDLIGWLPLNRIASLDASLPFILLQSTTEMELCLLPNCYNHFLLLPFDCALICLTPIQHML
jgi:hypothetical protein